MTKIAPDGRLEPEDGGGLLSAVGVPNVLEKIGLSDAPARYQDASVAKKEVLRSARDLPRNMTSRISRLDAPGTSSFTRAGQWTLLEINAACTDARPGSVDVRRSCARTNSATRFR